MEKRNDATKTLIESIWEECEIIFDSYPYPLLEEHRRHRLKAKKKFIEKTYQEIKSKLYGK